MKSTCIEMPTKQEHGGGEMEICKLRTLEQSPSFPTVVATEILEEVLDNVFNQVVPQKDKENSEKITTNVVSDILDNILLTPTKEETNTKIDETNLLDEEIKKMIKEMKSPTEVAPCCKPGVGDQITDKEEIITKPSKVNVVEKKTRFTNLLRNSRHLIRYANKKDCEMKWEEKHEKIIKLTDLDTSTSSLGNEIKQSSVDLPGLSESTMDIIDLEAMKKEDSGEGNIQEKEKLEIENACAGAIKEPNKKKKGIASKLLRLFKRSSKN